MKAYEAVFILDERKFEDGGETFASQFASLVEELGGTVTEKIPMGRKQFARPIKKLNAGIYWDFTLQLDPAKVAVLKSRFQLDDSVLRLVVLDFVAATKKVELKED